MIAATATNGKTLGTTEDITHRAGIAKEDLTKELVLNGECAPP